MHRKRIRKGLLRIAAACTSIIMLCTSPLTTEALSPDAPFPIAWQQSEEAGADIQRSLYLSEQESWCNYPWNRGSETGNSIGLAGCSLLSVINSVYYKTGEFLNPVILAEFALAEGYRTPGVDGVAISFFSGFSDVFGESCDTAFLMSTSDAERVLEHVRSGGTSCSNIYGHWIAIVDYDPENDLYLILDSSHTSKRSANITWTDKENGIAWLTPDELLETGRSGYYGIGERYSALFQFEYTFSADTGDANGNGVVDINDANAALTYYAGVAAEVENNTLHPHPEQNAACLTAADVNTDNAITVEDASGILEYYAASAAGFTPEW
ncbi:MAG: hypothetical protein IJ512_04640 [Ruminococcus sp.]|nr:hypothetical protein [Ruminococcus sp.]